MVVPVVVGLAGGCRGIVLNMTTQWRREVPPAEQPPAMTLHIVCHSHLDPGWLSRVDELFATSVHGIIDAVVTALSSDPKARRTFAPEIAVFYDMWWQASNETMRAKVRSVVSDGRMEWAGGGWTQHDEAATRFEDQLDNMALGHLWLQSLPLHDGAESTSSSASAAVPPRGPASTRCRRRPY